DGLADAGPDDERVGAGAKQLAVNRRRGAGGVDREDLLGPAEELEVVVAGPLVLLPFHRELALRKDLVRMLGEEQLRRGPWRGVLHRRGRRRKRHRPGEQKGARVGRRVAVDRERRVAVAAPRGDGGVREARRPVRERPDGLALRVAQARLLPALPP